MTRDELSRRVQAAFPVEPMPEKYSRPGLNLSGDIPGELAKRIIHRPWTDISMADWAMTGVPPSVARAYLDANAFRYYLPSLLIGSLADIDYAGWTMECLLPAGRARKTTGDWWQAFFGGFSQEQHVVIRQYLALVRSLLSQSSHSDVLYHAEEASSIWGAQQA